MAPGSFDLTRWERVRERREARPWTSRWLVALAAGTALAALTGWRAAAAGASAGSHAWLAGSVTMTALAFMRVPFHIYWRGDAALLAQLPISGAQLFAAAARRCARAAAATALACAIGAAPLVTALSHALAVRHAALVAVLGITAACLLPAVAIWAAMIVAAAETERGARAIQIATAAAGANPARAAMAAGAPQQPGSAGAVLGALPGFASAVVVVLVIVVAPWLTGGDPALDAGAVLGGVTAASIAALAAVRAAAPRVMGTILRDVSALDRQRLATLEINPPTAIERRVARWLGAAGLPYRKDVRLMRRRYPMAFALGSFAFLVVVIVGLARPDDPVPWLVAVGGGGALYGAVLAERLRRTPIELPRLTATLPIEGRARQVAKAAWVTVWAVIFVVVPMAFALARLG